MIVKLEAKFFYQVLFIAISSLLTQCDCKRPTSNTSKSISTEKPDSVPPGAGSGNSNFTKRKPGTEELLPNPGEFSFRKPKLEKLNPSPESANPTKLKEELKPNPVDSKFNTEEKKPISKVKQPEPTKEPATQPKGKGEQVGLKELKLNPEGIQFTPLKADLSLSPKKSSTDRFNPGNTEQRATPILEKRKFILTPSKLKNSPRQLTPKMLNSIGLNQSTTPANRMPRNLSPRKIDFDAQNDMAEGPMNEKYKPVVQELQQKAFIVEVENKTTTQEIKQEAVTPVAQETKQEAVIAGVENKTITQEIKQKINTNEEKKTLSQKSDQGPSIAKKVKPALQQTKKEFITETMIENAWQYFDDQDENRFDISFLGNQLLAFDENSSTVDINAKDSKEAKMTALSYAVVTGHKATVQALIDRGAAINIPDKDGATSLHHAVDIEGNAEVLSLLLDRATKEDLEMQDINGNTPFMTAIISGDLEMVKLLVNKGADIETKNKNNNTALMTAVLLSNAVSVHYLLEHDANIGAVDALGRTPLSLAAVNGNLDIVKCLVGDNPKIKNVYNIGAAAKQANIESPDATGRTPLSWAAATGNIGIVRYLVEQGANVDSVDNTGRTPLSWAAGTGTMEVISYLIEKAADINTPDKNGYSPLQYAMDYQRKDVEKCFRNATIARIQKIRPSNFGTKSSLPPSRIK